MVMIVNHSESVQAVPNIPSFNPKEEREVTQAEAEILLRNDNFSLIDWEKIPKSSWEEVKSSKPSTRK